MRRGVVLLGVVFVGILVLLLAWATRSAPDGDVPEGAPTGRDAVAADPQRAGPPARRTHAEGAPEERDATARAPASAPTSPGPTLTIHGVVLDAAHAPVAAAEVRLHRIDPNARGFLGLPAIDLARPERTARTGSDGRFAWGDVPTDDVIVVAAKEGLSIGAKRPDADETVLVLAPGELRRFEVVDGAGAPVAGALLRFCTTSAELAAVVADARGRAEFRCGFGVDAIVEAPGFARETVAITDEDETGVAEPCRIVLGEGRTVAGVVVDADGAPLAGVRVELCEPRGTWATAPRTKDDGRFAFEGLRASEGLDRWTLRAYDEPHGVPEVPVVPGDESVRIVMHREAAIRGIVVFDDGTPARGAHVWPHGLSAPEGEFLMTHLAPGRHELWGRVRSRVDPCMELEGQALVDVEEGASVEGVRIVVGPPRDQSFLLVRTLDGERPLPAHVIAWRDGVDVGDSWMMPDEAKRDGAVLLEVRQPPGTPIDLGATIGTPLAPRPMDARTSKPVATEGGPPFTPIDLRLGDPARVRIRLIDAEGREVPLRAEEIDREASFADGTFAARAIETFRAVVRVPGAAPRTLEFRPPHPPLREVTVRLEPGRAAVGRLVAADGSAFATGAEVQIWVLADSGSHEDSAEPDENGHFAFRGLPRGRAQLRVLVADDVTLFREFEIDEEDVDLGDLGLGAPATITGLVVDAGGRGLGGAIVEFLDPGGAEYAGAVSTRPDGRFERVLRSAAPPRLRVRRDGFATRLVDLSANTPRPVRVVLAPAGSVRVVVRKWADAGWGRVEVRLPGTDHAFTPHFASGSLITGNVYDDLPAGAVDVALVLRNGELVKRVEIVPGRTAEVVFGE